MKVLSEIKGHIHTDVINVKEREAEILKKVENVPAETSESSG